MLGRVKWVLWILQFLSSAHQPTCTFEPHCHPVHCLFTKESLTTGLLYKCIPPRYIQSINLDGEQRKEQSYMDGHTESREIHIRAKTTGVFVGRRRRGREDLAGGSCVHPVTGKEAEPQPTMMSVALHNHTAPCLSLCARKQHCEAKGAFNVILL